MAKRSKISATDMTKAEDLELEIVAAIAKLNKFLGILAHRYDLQTPVQVDWKHGLMEVKRDSD